MILHIDRNVVMKCLGPREINCTLGRWRQYVHPKRWYLPTSLHGVTTQKTNIVIFTAMRTSDNCITCFSHLIIVYKKSILLNFIRRLNLPEENGVTMNKEEG
jgi:hypothetical protein